MRSTRFSSFHSAVTLKPFGERPRRSAATTWIPSDVKVVRNSGQPRVLGTVPPQAYLTEVRNVMGRSETVTLHMVPVSVGPVSRRPSARERHISAAGSALPYRSYSQSSART